MMLSGYGDSKILKRAQMVKDLGLYPFFRTIEASDGNSVVHAGKRQIMIGSNNYLGLTHHPHVIEAAKKAIEKYGTGCTGSRFLNGNLSIHEELEDKLAQYLGHEKVLVFSTGMQANMGALSSLCGPKDCMLFDAENHASILDSARLAFGTTFKFKHNNMESLEELLISSVNRFEKTLIVADGVFSMTGDIINLPKLVELAEKYGAYVYVDDAHGLGVLGEKGKGTMHHFELTKKVHFNMGTFSKSFASIGGLISGRKEDVDHIKHSARSFMFSAAMPPSAVATVSACLDVINSNEPIHKNLWDNVEFMQKGFKEIGFYTYNSKTPIISIFIGDDIKALQVTKFLEEKGVFATPVLSPAVPKGEALIRTSYMATHQKDELSIVLEVFKEAKEKFTIPGLKH